MKTLALAQHLGLEVFTYNTKNGEDLTYVGMTQEEFDQKEEGFLIAYDTREEVDKKLIEIIGDLPLLEDEIIVSSYDDCVFEAEGNEYLVCDNEEAEQKWEESIDNYIDECVLSELPEQYRQYFDNEKFKRDCSFDGRGHTLSTYDGNENEETIDFTTYYIYRTN